MKRFDRHWVAVLMAACLVVSGCRRGPEADANAKNASADEALPVETTTVTRGGIEAILRSSAHLEAEEEVKVLARTANRVAELLVEEGDKVTEGQVLVRLESDNQRTALGKAQINRDKAREDFEREKALFEQKLISEQIYNTSEYEYKRLELAFEDAQRELDYTVIRAPITGTISQRLVKSGDMVNLNQHLFDIVDFDSIVARIYLPEKHLKDLQLNQAARVTSESIGDAGGFTGYVKRIAPVVESKSGTVKVTIGFKNTDRLRPGMFVEVELITDQRPDALLITKRALVYDGELSYVFRLLPGRKVERVLVDANVDDKMNVEPMSGFREGDEIVVAGQSGLKDGAKVRLPSDPNPKASKDKQANQAGQPPTAKKS